jgi:hypothetical protein
MNWTREILKLNSMSIAVVQEKKEVQTLDRSSQVVDLQVQLGLQMQLMEV